MTEALTFTGQTPSGRSFYRVVALDRAGNRSAASSPVTVDGPTPAPAPPTVRTVTAVADTYGNAKARSTNFGTSQTVLSGGGSGGVAYLRFDLPAAPAGQTMTSAVLRFRTTVDPGAGSLEEHAVSLAGDDWSETTLTYDDRPGLGQRLGTVQAGTEVDRQHTTTLAPGALTAGRNTLAITNQGNDSLQLRSREDPTSDRRPTLVVTYTSAS